MSIASKCLAFSGLFEAELLIELMLRHWEHPLADDKEFRNELLEGAADVLRICIAGQPVIEDIPADQMNFVAAVWYVEWSNLGQNERDPADPRRAWLEKVRRSVPSCFCPLENLP
jgi:hypothetical protein